MGDGWKNLDFGRSSLLLVLLGRRKNRRPIRVEFSWLISFHRREYSISSWYGLQMLSNTRKSKIVIWVGFSPADFHPSRCVFEAPSVFLIFSVKRRALFPSTKISSNWSRESKCCAVVRTPSIIPAIITSLFEYPWGVSWLQLGDSYSLLTSASGSTLWDLLTMPRDCCFENMLLSTWDKTSFWIPKHWPRGQFQLKSPFIEDALNT